MRYIILCTIRTHKDGHTSHRLNALLHNIQTIKAFIKSNDHIAENLYSRQHIEFPEGAA